MSAILSVSSPAAWTGEAIALARPMPATVAAEVFKNSRRVPLGCDESCVAMAFDFVEGEDVLEGESGARAAAANVMRHCQFNPPARQFQAMRESDCVCSRVAGAVSATPRVTRCSEAS